MKKSTFYYVAKAGLKSTAHFFDENDFSIQYEVVRNGVALNTTSNDLWVQEMSKVTSRKNDCRSEAHPL